MDTETIVGFLKSSGINLFYGLLILVIGFFLIHYIMKLIERKGSFVKLEPTVRGFLVNLIRLTLYVIVVLTAANPNETSKADVHDKQLGVYLSNAFARTFRRDIDQNPAVTIYDLYKDLARTTTGSHVMLYNQLFYGSVYTETMSDYFPE